MSESARKSAAAKFRREIRRSNKLHTAYLDDPIFLDQYDRFTNWQLQYLLPFFSDLHAEEGYAEAIDFTMSDLAGVGISNRDRDLERAAPAITRMLPTRALATIAAAAEMNAQVLKVNTAICRCLLVDDALPEKILELDYCVACREASSLDECAELVHLITGLGQTLKSLVKIPALGITLRAMRAPAHAAGFGALQEFLENGFSTFRQIPDIDHFLEEIRLRMIQMFEIIYTAPLDDLQKPEFAAQQAKLLGRHSQ
ncbi:MAG: FFLEELY motif protein [Woeseiaceae bacterium]